MVVDYAQSSITIPSVDGRIVKTTTMTMMKKRKDMKTSASHMRTIPGHTVKST